MGKILDWTPLIWTARVLLVILMGGAALVTALYLSRFVRPKHVWALLTRDLPAFKNVGATLKVFGQELAANATLDNARDEVIEAQDRRLAAVEQQVGALVEAVASMAESVQHLEEAD